MNEFKKLFDGIDVPEPASGFEDRIIANALTQKAANQNNRLIRRFGMVACLAIIISVYALSTRTSTNPDYYYLVSGDEVVTEDDMYNDLLY
jgi:hypothetical protein